MPGATDGARRTETLKGAISTYSYPGNSSRLTSIVSASATRSFAYDAAGNVLTDSRSGALGMTFAYDVEGRLASAYLTAQPSTVATYGYAAFGAHGERDDDPPARGLVIPTAPAQP